MEYEAMTSRWSALPLKDVIGFKKGKKPKVLFYTPIADGLPYLLIENFGKVATGYTNDKTCGMACEQDTLLVCDGARTGLASIGHRGYIGSTLAALSPDVSRILPEYLYYFIREKFTLLNSRTRGATIPHLDRELLFGLNIPLPQLNEQRRIVDILSRADGIVRLRREAEKKAAELIPALFLELFGDPATNPKGWAVALLPDVLSRPFKNGLYLPKEQYAPEDSAEGVEMVHMSDAFYGEVKRGKLRRVLANEKHINEYGLTNHDLLVARRSLTFEGAAKLCGIPSSEKPLIFESSFIRLSPRDEIVLTDYLLFYLNNENTRRAYVRSRINGITISGINQAALGQIPVMLPNLTVQQNFVGLVDQIRSIQSQQSAATAKAQATFDALLARCFQKPTVA